LAVAKEDNEDNNVTALMLDQSFQSMSNTTIGGGLTLPMSARPNAAPTAQKEAITKRD